MQEQKRYHQRKLAIIEMIEECEKMIKREHRFLISLPSGFIDAVKNSTKTIQRYERIKQRLMKWLSETKNIPAFPLIDEIGNYIQEGMTLRDYAHIKFMSAIISNSDSMRELTREYKNQSSKNKIEFEDIISKVALLYAYSMLKQREL